MQNPFVYSHKQTQLCKGVGTDSVQPQAICKWADKFKVNWVGTMLQIYIFRIRLTGLSQFEEVAIKNICGQLR